jgi:hypothetical protein
MANSMTLTGEVISVSPVDGATLCRVSGTLTDVMGRSLSGWSLVLRYAYCPIATLGGVVLKERLTAKADADGVVQFDLVRGSVVRVEVPGLLFDLPSRDLTVPDAASVTLTGFLFPYPDTIDWLDDTALEVAAGDIVSVPVSVTLTDGSVVDLPSSRVTVESSDTGVVSVSGLTITAEGSGAATLTITAFDVDSLVPYTDNQGNTLTFTGIPDPTVVAAPLSITVT